MLTLTQSNFLVANYYVFPFYIVNDITIKFCILSILRSFICIYKPYAFNKCEIIISVL